MSFYERVIRPIAFRFDPEFVHERALWMLAHGWIPDQQFVDPSLEQTLFGTRFSNPLGLAAGFDKNGVALDQWHRLGFGYVEAGTVTYHGQPGNDRPRVFRLPADQALINRLGFNNRGAAAFAAQIQRSQPKIPIGINLGKSRIVELTDAASDYRQSYELLHSFGDYFVINVSSPNTPGLRSLQDKGPLLEIIAAIRSVDPVRPLFVKVAPDLELDALDEIAQLAIDSKLTGLIATNTTLSREGLVRDPGQAGGLSGRPLFERANAVLSHLYRVCPRDMILIGVGGIFSSDDLYRKIACGAHLCQVYTGWVYGGPSFAPKVLRQLARRLKVEGFANVTELRGSADHAARASSIKAEG